MREERRARHDEIAPLDMRMRRVRAEAGRAGVPAEMMQLVAGVGHRRPCRRSASRTCTPGRHRPRRWRPASCALRIEGRDIGERLAALLSPPCAARDRSLDPDAKWPLSSSLMSVLRLEPTERRRVEQPNTSCGDLSAARLANGTPRSCRSAIGEEFVWEASGGRLDDRRLCRRHAAQPLFAQEDDSPRTDDDRRSDQGVQLGTSSKKTKPKMIAQTISVY